MLNFHILRSHSVLGVAGRMWCSPAGLLQCLWLERDSWLLAGTSPQARWPSPQLQREEAGYNVEHQAAISFDFIPL